MSSFIDAMAEESENESSGSELNEPKAKKLKKTKKKHRISSDEEEEEEEEDDAKMREEMQGFIVDNPEEEEEGEDKSEDEKSEKSEEDFGELSEEDLEVINENLGIEVGGRVQLSDDEDEDVRERIEKDLFDRGGGESPEEREERPAYDRDEDESRSESEMSEDPFIVQDDAGKSHKRRKKTYTGGISGHVVDEAREVFGVDDFNIDEFYEEDEEEMEPEEEEEEIIDEEGEEGEIVRVKRPPKVRPKKETLMSSIEPSDLEKGFVSAQDKKILFEDKPERFQLRKIPVTDAEEKEFETEARWIYDYCFNYQPITTQPRSTLSIHWQPYPPPEKDKEYAEYRGDTVRADEEAPQQITEALNCIRKQIFEVPFIAFYRKEAVFPWIANPLDLWRVYDFDEKWCLLRQRKDKLKSLMERMENYMRESGSEQVDRMRKITARDHMAVDGVITMEDLADVSAHFHLYYGHEIHRMVEWEQVLEMRMGGDEHTRFKMGARTDKFQLCIQCGLAPLAEKFGLTAEQYAENLAYLKHDIQQPAETPLDAAKDFTSENFPTPEEALKGAIYMVAMELSRQPLVRSKLRKMYMQSLNLSVRPTKKGREMIDESHPLYAMKYLRHKPAKDFKDDEYLLLTKAQTEGLIEIKFHVEEVSTQLIFGQEAQKRLTFEEFIQVYHRDEFHFVAEEWNKVRKEAVLMCCREILLPSFQKEFHEKMLQEARENVLRASAFNMYQRIKWAPFSLTHKTIEEGKIVETRLFSAYPEEMDEDVDMDHKSVRILAIAYSSDPLEAAFGAIIDQNGVMFDHLRLVHFTKRINTFAEKNPDLRDARENSKLKKMDLTQLKEFVMKHRPHCIVLGAENFDAMRLKRDIADALMELMRDQELHVNIPVEIIDNEAAKVYMNSQMAFQEFPSYPAYLRQAVSLARLIWDPLVEYAHLCSPDNDVLFCKFHPLQDQVNQIDLLNVIQRELINRVNEVGVDINRCLEFPHTTNMLQFVCGLGPRKAANLLKMLKQNDSILESRTKLVTMCRMGPKVFMNCAGFIKIATDQIAEGTDAYVEVLDSSRIHPETYEWARKMAVDALEADDNMDPTSALEEILAQSNTPDEPNKLDELDLDAFAAELERQGFGKKKLTLYDIRAELTFRYLDVREAYPQNRPTDEQMFQLLTRDSLSDFKPGRLMLGKVQRVRTKAPTEKDIDRFTNDPDRTKYMERLDDEGKWRCRFCDSFTADNAYEIESQHWIFQLENGRNVCACKGKPVGIDVRFDNGIMGTVYNENLSDNADFKDPLQRVKIGAPIYCRVLKVEFSLAPPIIFVECSTKSSDLRNPPSDLIAKDPYYDQDLELADQQEADRAKQAQHITTRFVKRVISHPSFHNVTCKDAERMLNNMELGEAIIRPSSLGVEFLTVTWKVAEDIYQHIVVREKDKKHYFNIGKVLYIGEESFEDLDEILARHIQPMAALAREVLQYKYYMDGVRAEEKEKIETHLQTEKKRQPSRIPYAITASFKYGGKFVISYMPTSRGKVIHEYFTLTPDGIRFRKRVFNGVEEMVNWFKVHFREMPQMPSRRMDSMPDRTPGSYAATSDYQHQPVLPPHPPGIKPPPPNPNFMSNPFAQPVASSRQRPSRFEPMDTSSGGFGGNSGFGQGSSGGFGQSSRFGASGFRATGFDGDNASESSFASSRRGGDGFRGGREGGRGRGGRY